MKKLFKKLKKMPLITLLMISFGLGLFIGGIGYVTAVLSNNSTHVEMCYSAPIDYAVETGQCFAEQKYPGHYVTYLQENYEDVACQPETFNYTACDNSQRQIKFVERKIPDWVKENVASCRVNVAIEVARLNTDTSGNFD